MPLRWPRSVRLHSPVSSDHIFIVLSHEPDASSFDCVMCKREFIHELWPTRVRMHAPVLMHQILMVQSHEPDTIWCVRGKYNRHSIQCSWPVSVCKQAPLWASHILMVLSHEPLMILFVSRNVFVFGVVAFVLRHHSICLPSFRREWMCSGNLTCFLMILGIVLRRKFI